MDELLDMFLPQAPAIALDGARGAGRADTVLQRATKVFLLDRPDRRAFIEADPDGIRRPGTTLLDEQSRMPKVWDFVRRKVDNEADPGSFLLTGSAAPVTAQGTHSGAERVLSLRMCPMAFRERGQLVPAISLTSLLAAELPCSTKIEGHTSCCLAGYLDVIVAGGFPGIMSPNPDLQVEQLATYIQYVIDRNLPDLGYGVRRPRTLRHWLAAYAVAFSTATSYSELLDTTTCGGGQQPTRGIAQTYRDYLTQLWLLDPVPGWGPSHSPLTRLQQAPKHQLADPAPAASLLSVTASSMTAPRYSHLAGPLFEAPATLTARVATEAARVRVDHLRARNSNRKIGLVAKTYNGRIVAIEVEPAASMTDPDVQHLA